MSGSESLAVAGSPNASFRAEVLEEAMSPTRFLFFSRSLSSEIVGGGDVVESLSSRDPWLHLHLDFHQPRGLLNQLEQDQPRLVLPWKDEGKKPKIGGPTKSIHRKALANNTRRQRTEINIFEL
jgi:hypothetical protein